MLKLLLILLLISFDVTAVEPPAKINITCSKSNDCKLNLKLTDGWKVYAHDENNPESLNFTIDTANSNNVESIEVNWESQKVQSAEVFGMKIDYYENGSDINFKLFTREDNYKLSLDINYAACNKFCTVFKDRITYSGRNNLDEMSIVHILILALLGGLILNCMPCVLPIVWLKVMHISKKCKTNTRKTRIEILYISLGIITSFAILAIITILMRNLGHVVGWGMHFQEPIFVGIIAIITGFGGMNMLSIFSLNTSPFIQRILDRSDGKIADFLHGIFVVLLATPCTAPFLGTAVAFCLTQPSQFILLVYLSIGLGLSLPYLVLAVFPGMLRILPKPGRWMEKFKFVAAIPFILTSIWMLYVLYRQSPYGAMGLIGVMLIPMMKYSVKISFISAVILGIIYICSSLSNSKVGWEDFQIEKISDEVKLGRTVLVNITSDWCITCKVNEKMVFSNEAILHELKKSGTILIEGDYTSNSKNITDYIKMNNRSGIPLSVVYGPAAPGGIVLPVIFTKEELINAIDKARKM